MLEHGKGLRVLIWFQEHCQAAQTQQGVDPDFSALGVLDGGAEEFVQVGRLAREGIAGRLKRCPDDVCTNLPVSCVLACGCLVQVARQVGPLSIFEVLGRDGGNDTGSGVPGQGVVFVQCELKQLVAERGLLFSRQVRPVLGHKLSRLNCCQLAELWLGMPA
jgi:hypothetical protein